MKAFIDAPLLIYLNTLSEPVKRALYENFYMNVLSIRFTRTFSSSMR